MGRAADQKKVVKFALYRGRLVPRDSIPVAEGAVGALLSSAPAAPTGIEGVEAPAKRRGRPPKALLEPSQVAELETVAEPEADAGDLDDDHSEFLIGE